MPAERAAYPDVPDKPRFPAIEEAVLASWAAEGTFEASVALRPAGEAGANEYVFYDGPPFANGLPHYGHLLTGYVKDAVPRYQTMRGRRVERRFGWDCHGLPAETEAEKELGVSGRGPITEYGIDRFNDYCRTSVLRYTHEWERYVTRQARWVDFDNDYKTMDLTYMESVMWALKQLWDKGLLYEGYRVLPYCWECETPLSNFETRQDNAYRDRQDPAVTVAFTLEPDAAAPAAVAGEVQLWVWTTTPWTLPSNLALAVGPDIDYAVFERDGSRGRGRRGAWPTRTRRSWTGAEQVGTVTGPTWSAAATVRCSPTSPAHPNAFRVLAADFVTHRGGHRDRAHGARLRRGRPARLRGRRHRRGLPGRRPDPLHRRGPRLRGPAGLRGQPADHPAPARATAPWSAPTPTCTATPTAGAPTRRSSTRPSAPGSCRSPPSRTACWPTTSRSRWVPGHVRDGSFGKWLEDARDWSISRNRLLGLPDPGLEERRPRLPPHRRVRQPGRAGSRLRGPPDRPAPARHRRADPAQPRRPDRAGPPCAG